MSIRNVGEVLMLQGKAKSGHFGGKASAKARKLDTLKDLKVPGAKNDAGKLRIGLVDDVALEALASVLTLGAAKYTEGGWRQVEDAERRYYEATMRHLLKWRKFLRTGRIEDAIDEETGLPHLAQALCNIHFLTALYLQKHDPEFDAEKASREAIERWTARADATFEVSVGVRSPRSRARRKGALQGLSR